MDEATALRLELISYSIWYHTARRLTQLPHSQSAFWSLGSDKRSFRSARADLGLENRLKDVQRQRPAGAGWQPAQQPKGAVNR